MGFPARCPSPNPIPFLSMNKTEILAALRAANVACDDSMTVPQLKELAAANNVSLVKASKPAAEDTPAAEDGPSDDELIAAKVAAGLRYEQAVEVVASQRAADAAAAGRE
jgi:hypothetical protein